MFEYDQARAGREVLRLARHERDQLARAPRAQPVAAVERDRRRERVVRDARGVVEQLADRDLAAVGKDPGQPPLDGVLERQPALVDELEHDGGDERLAHARDAEAERGSHPAARLPRSATPRAPLQVELPSSTSATMPGAPAATTPSSACSSAGRWAAAGAGAARRATASSAASRRIARRPAPPHRREEGRMGMTARAYRGPRLAWVDAEAFAEHLRFPRGRGDVPAGSFRGAAGGAACGDLVRIDVRVDGDRVAGAGFEAVGLRRRRGGRLGRRDARARRARPGRRARRRARHRRRARRALPGQAPRGRAGRRRAPRRPGRRRRRRGGRRRGPAPHAGRHERRRRLGGGRAAGRGARAARRSR